MKATNLNIVLQAAALAAWARIISTELALFSALHHQVVVVGLFKRVRWASRESEIEFFSLHTLHFLVADQGS